MGAAADADAGIAVAVDEEALAALSEVLLGALQSLYDDRLLPRNHHVARRVEERSGVRWSAEDLIRVVRATPGVHLKGPDAANRFVILLDDVVGNFVDLSSREDKYPADLWSELRSFVDDGWPEDGVPSGSRYDLARGLQEHVPGLQRYGLGEVVHVVQLAVRSHRILGYKHGRLVPYRSSTDCEKWENAVQLRPTGAQDANWVTAWANAKSMLTELLMDERWPQGIPVSALKARFRQQFGCDFNETALGHTKLSSLLQDPRLATVCQLERCGSERLLRRARPTEPCSEERVSAAIVGLQQAAWELPSTRLWADEKVEESEHEEEGVFRPRCPDDARCPPPPSPPASPAPPPSSRAAGPAAAGRAQHGGSIGARSPRPARSRRRAPPPRRSSQAPVGLPLFLRRAPAARPPEDPGAL